MSKKPISNEPVSPQSISTKPNTFPPEKASSLNLKMVSGSPSSQLSPLFYLSELVHDFVTVLIMPGRNAPEKLKLIQEKLGKLISELK